MKVFVEIELFNGQCAHRLSTWPPLNRTSVNSTYLGDDPGGTASAGICFGVVVCSCDFTGELAARASYDLTS